MKLIIYIFYITDLYFAIENDKNDIVQSLLAYESIDVNLQSIDIRKI